MLANITYISVLLLMCLKFCHLVDLKKFDNNYGVELQQTINLARQEYLQDMCDVYNGENVNSLEYLTSQDLDHILVDHEHKLLYCYVPKVACTNWKRVLMYLKGAWNSTDILSIPANQAHAQGIFENLGMSEDINERTRILNEYTRFIMVRHPFERLLSAYRNKLQGNSSSALYFQSRIGRHIIKNFRKKPTNESLFRGHDVTFREFCEYLVTIDRLENNTQNKLFSKKSTIEPDTKNYNSNTIKVEGNKENLRTSTVRSSTSRNNVYEVFNEHWKPASRLCHPCAIKYNVIGKYETLREDSKLLLSMIGVSNKISFPSRTSSTASHLARELKTIPVDLLEKLYRVYEMDFKIFGYGLEALLGFELA